MAYQEKLTLKLKLKSKSKSKIFTVEIRPFISKLKEENLSFNLEVKEENFIFLKSQVSKTSKIVNPQSLSLLILILLSTSISIFKSKNHYSIFSFAF